MKDGRRAELESSSKAHARSALVPNSPNTKHDNNNNNNNNNNNLRHSCI